MLPSEYLELEQSEKAFIIASIMVKREEEEKQEKKMKSKAKRK